MFYWCLSFYLFLAVLPCMAEKPCLRWDIPKDVVVNRRQGERLYLEACRWVNQRLAKRDAPKPCITVHVGLACPDTAIQGPCANPVSGDIYVPEWDSLSPATVAQGTIATSLLQLLTPSEISLIAEQLLAQDAVDYADYIASEQK